MEATLSLHHHLYPKPFFNNTQNTSIRPCLSFSHHHQYRFSLFPDTPLRWNRVKKPISLPRRQNNLWVPQSNENTNENKPTAADDDKETGHMPTKKEGAERNAPVPQISGNVMENIPASGKKDGVVKNVPDPKSSETDKNNVAEPGMKKGNEENAPVPVPVPVPLPLPLPQANENTKEKVSAVGDNDGLEVKVKVPRASENTKENIPAAPENDGNESAKAIPKSSETDKEHIAAPGMERNEGNVPVLVPQANENTKEKVSAVGDNDGLEGKVKVPRASENTKENIPAAPGNDKNESAEAIPKSSETDKKNIAAPGMKEGNESNVPVPVPQANENSKEKVSAVGDDDGLEGKVKVPQASENTKENVKVPQASENTKENVRGPGEKDSAKVSMLQSTKSPMEMMPSPKEKDSIEKNMPVPQASLSAKENVGVPGNIYGDGEQMPRMKGSTSTSGKVAMERMLKAKRTLLDPKLLDTAETEFINLLKQETIDWNNLQEAAWKLEMSGREDKAVKMLKKRFNKEVKRGQACKSYELGLLLVEMMIYQGNYRPARTICTPFLKERRYNDTRPPLYMAVTNAMLGEMKEASERWKEFTKNQSLHESSAKPTANKESQEKDESILTFEKFIQHMEVLEQEIALH